MLGGAAADDVGRGGLDRAAAEHRHHARLDLRRQPVRLGVAARAVEVALDRAAADLDVDRRLRAAVDVQHRRVQPQPPDRLGQAVVVGEDDDLARPRGAVQDAREAVDLGRVHGLHRVVDDREAERRLVERRARQEDADREREQLALGHHPERVGALAVGAHVEVGAAAAARLLERDVVQVDARALPQLAPVGDRALGDRREALRPQRLGRALDPLLGVLERLQRARAGLDLARALEPARDVHRQLLPGGAAPVELGTGARGERAQRPRGGEQLVARAGDHVVRFQSDAARERRRGAGGGVEQGLDAPAGGGERAFGARQRVRLRVQLGGLRGRGRAPTPRRARRRCRRPGSRRSGARGRGSRAPGAAARRSGSRAGRRSWPRP